MKTSGIILLILTVSACDRNGIEPFSYWNEPVTGMVFVQIPGGNFTMGNLEGDSLSSNEERKHEVIISKNFWLGQSEVTQEQWQKIMGKEEAMDRKYSLFLEISDDKNGNKDSDGKVLDMKHVS